MQANLSSVVERFPAGERAGRRRSHPTSLSASRFDMVGWAVQIDAKLSVYRTITAASGNTITVDGDLTGLVTVDETEFCIIHPSGVDPENGATQTDPCVPERALLFSLDRGR